MSEKRIIAFDLETIADKTMMDILPEVKVKKNLKDPAKIIADIEEKQKKQIQEMAMSPLTNMICCAGWCDSEGTNSILLKEESPEAEKVLLEEFWEVLLKYDHFVTFNGRAFDLRCMHLHGIQHRIRPAVNIDKGRYNKAGGNHTDLRPVYAGEGQFASGKLDFFAKKFLGDQKTEGIDGQMVADYWEMGLVEDIATYCEQDAKLTFELFHLADQAGLIE